MTVLQAIQRHISENYGRIDAGQENRSELIQTGKAYGLNDEAAVLFADTCLTLGLGEGEPYQDVTIDIRYNRSLMQG